MTTQAIVTEQDLTDYLAGDREQRIAQVTAKVRAFCGWHVAPTITETVVLRGTGGVLLLPSLNVTAVASINDREVSDDQWQANGVVSGRWAERNHTVTFTHGYEVDDVADFTSIILSATAGILRSPDGRLPTRMQIGQASIGYSGDGGVPLRQILSQADMAVLDKYRLPPRP